MSYASAYLRSRISHLPFCFFFLRTLKVQNFVEVNKSALIILSDIKRISTISETLKIDSSLGFDLFQLTNFFFYTEREMFLNRTTFIHFHCWSKSFTETTTAWIIIFSIFITYLEKNFEYLLKTKNASDLSATTSSTVLTSVNKSSIPIRTNNSIIKPCLIDISHCMFSILSSIIFNKTKST